MHNVESTVHAGVKLKRHTRIRVLSTSGERHGRKWSRGSHLCQTGTFSFPLLPPPSPLLLSCCRHHHHHHHIDIDIISTCSFPPSSLPSFFSLRARVGGFLTAGRGSRRRVSRAMADGAVRHRWWGSSPTTSWQAFIWAVDMMARSIAPLGSGRKVKQQRLGGRGDGRNSSRGSESSMWQILVRSALSGKSPVATDSRRQEW